MESDFVVSRILTAEETEVIVRIHVALFSPVFDKTDGDERSEGIISITSKEAEMLYKVIRIFRHFCSKKGEYSLDNEVLPANDEFNSSLSFEDSYVEPAVSPGRFIVRVTERDRTIIKEVHDKVQLEKSQIERNLNEEQPMDVVDDKGESAWSSTLSRISKRFHSTRKTVTVTEQHIDPTIASLQANNNMDNNAISTQQLEQLCHGRENGTIVTHDVRDDRKYSTQGLPPLERFRQVVRTVIKQNRKRQRYLEFWKQRGDAGYLEIVLTVLSIVFVIADLASDLKVTADHFEAGDYSYGVLTALLLLVSAVIVNVMSFLCYKDDEEEVDGRMPISGWRVVIVTHSLLLGLLERYWRVLVKAYRIKTRRLRGVQHYKEHVSMNLDVTLLYVILAFTEDAPQLVLQLYTLFRRYIQQAFLVTSLRDLWTIISVFMSFISYSRVVVDYVKCLRDSKKHRGRLQWHMYFLMWFWRSLLFTSRVLVLVFFATKFTYWIFVVLFIHSIIILVLIRNQKVSFFPGQPWKQRFIRVVIAFIHTFCIFLLEAHTLVQWAAMYYTLIFLEALILTMLCYTSSNTLVSAEFELAGVLIIVVCYVMGVAMMMMYYKCLHPDLAVVTARQQTRYHRGYHYRRRKDSGEVSHDIESTAPEENVKENKKIRELWGFD